MVQEIEWVHRGGPGNPVDGFVMIVGTKVQIATIAWGVSSDKDKPWSLSISLPGFNRKPKPAETPERAEEIAQAILRTFVKALS